MKIYLKHDWDYQPSYETTGEGGHFAGRQKEKNELMDEFLRKDNGSILVSGARGVGKTSLIFEALRASTKKDSRIVPIVLNASQLDLHSVDEEKGGKEGTSLPKIIIENLIRRLYGYFQTDDHKKKIDTSLYTALGDLYKKTTAKEYNALEMVKESNEENSSDTDSTTNESAYSLDKKYFLNISYVIGILVLFAPAIYRYFFNQMIAVILLLLPTFSFKYLNQVKKRIEKKFTSRNTAESLYKVDASLSNLEYELNTLLKLFLKNNVKIIFVIDELDKLEHEGRPEYIFDIIKTFKNLFTLSSALFIFITSDKAYRKVIDAKKTRSAHYTLFTNRIFLNRPNFQDLDGFLNDIILKIEDDGIIITRDFEKKLVGQKLSQFKSFKSHLFFKAKSDYFELSLMIRDYVSTYIYESDKRISIIDVNELKTSDKLLSKIQKVIEQIFDINKIQEQSEWHQNDNILSDLYNFLDQYFDQTSFDIDFKEVKPIIKDYFIPYLERLEIIHRIETRSVDPSSGETMNVGVFQWTGNIPGESGRPDIKNSPTERFPVEDSFILEAQKYIQIVNDIDDMEHSIPEIISGTFKKDLYDLHDDCSITETRDGQNLTALNAFNIYSKYEESVSGLMAKYPKHINRQELRKITKEISEEILKYKDTAFQIFTGLFRMSLAKKTIGFTQEILQNDNSLFDIFNILRDNIVNTSVQHITIYRTDPVKSKQLLITVNLSPDVLSDEVVKFLHNNKSYKLINIQTNLSLDYSKVGHFSEIKSVNVKKKASKLSSVIKTDSFKNIRIDDDYTVIVPYLTDLVDWFSKN